MLLALRKQSFFVTFFPIAVLDKEWTTIYSDFPRDIEVVNRISPPLLKAFLRHRHGYYNVIVISRPHNMSFLKPIMIAHPQWFEHTSIIYDTETLFAPRDAGLQQLRGEQLSEAEVAGIYRNKVELTSVADGVIAV